MKFAKISDDLSSFLAGTNVDSDPDAIIPGRAIVFEMLGPVKDIVKAMTSVGLEFLSEIEADGQNEEARDADEDAFSGADLSAAESSSFVGQPDRYYLSIPDEPAIERLLALWRAYSTGREPAVGEKPWWVLFGYLSDLRTWSAKDRVEMMVAGYVRKSLSESASRPVRLELDLWFRGTADERSVAAAEVAKTVLASGGLVLDTVTIEPIEYLAMLVDLPGKQALEIVDLAGPLATAAAVMSVRPQAIYRTPASNDHPAQADIGIPLASPDGRRPIVALLDGYPIENHDLLVNRVDVSEVDVVGGQVPVERRYHGTAMASLILHGDLAAGESPLDRMLRVVPILGAGQHLGAESLDTDRLALGTVYRAVLSMVEGLDGADATTPDLVLLNHSVCDERAPFIKRPSFWAKLLDYLSYEYRLLFIVSAGNRMEPVQLTSYSDRQAFLDDDPVDRQNKLLLALEGAKEGRRILSPAEGVNVLTVGALHGDEAGACPEGHVDPFLLPGLTAMYSGTGLGANRCVKPDLVEFGGRLVANAGVIDGSFQVWNHSVGNLGQLAACPVAGVNALNRVSHSAGTSGAAALVTRMGVQIADTVESLFLKDGIEWLNLPTRAVVLKALMAHGCEWSPISGELVNIFPPEGSRRDKAQDTVTRLVGNGRPAPSRVTGGSGQRITLLAEDCLSHDELHEYRLPIPAALIKCSELRRITLTLAWSTPIDRSTLGYRCIAMQLRDRNNSRKFWGGVSSVRQPKATTQMRGTLIHRVMEGKTAVRTAVQGGMFVGVQARAVSDHHREVLAPYALAISLEVGADVGFEIYEEVKSMVRQHANVSARVRQRT